MKSVAWLAIFVCLVLNGESSFASPSSSSAAARRSGEAPSLIRFAAADPSTTAASRGKSAAAPPNNVVTPTAVFAYTFTMTRSASVPIANVPVSKTIEPRPDPSTTSTTAIPSTTAPTSQGTSTPAPPTTAAPPNNVVTPTAVFGYTFTMTRSASVPTPSMTRSRSTSAEEATTTTTTEPPTTAAEQWVGDFVGDDALTPDVLSTALLARFGRDKAAAFKITRCEVRHNVTRADSGKSSSSSSSASSGSSNSGGSSESSVVCYVAFTSSGFATDAIAAANGGQLGTHVASAASEFPPVTDAPKAKEDDSAEHTKNVAIIIVVVAVVVSAVAGAILFVVRERRRNAQLGDKDEDVNTHFDQNDLNERLNDVPEELGGV